MPNCTISVIAESPCTVILPMHSFYLSIVGRSMYSTCYLEIAISHRVRAIGTSYKNVDPAGVTSTAAI